MTFSTLQYSTIPDKDQRPIKADPQRRSEPFSPKDNCTPIHLGEARKELEGHVRFSKRKSGLIDLIKLL